jgi:hypothetical protein
MKYKHLVLERNSFGYSDMTGGTIVTSPLDLRAIQMALDWATNAGWELVAVDAVNDRLYFKKAMGLNE